MILGGAFGITTAQKDKPEISDPRRVRREMARWEGLDQATRLGRIIVLDHGGRNRPIIHRGSRHLRTRPVSRKTGLLQISEGKTLPFLIRRCEIDAMVDDFQAHPFRIDLVVDGERVTWYPDLVWVRRGERPRLIEVKRNISEVDRDPDYRRKLEAMFEFAQRIGWTMQILYDDDILGRDSVRLHRFTNIPAIYSRKHLRLTKRELGRIKAFVKGKATMSWAEVRDTLDAQDALRADAVIECAVARGYMIFDFDQRRTSQTLLTPVALAKPSASIRL